MGGGVYWGVYVGVCVFFSYISFILFYPAFIELEWRLVFKAMSGVSQLDNTDPLLRDPFEVWNTEAPYNEDNPEARLLHNTCSFRGHYKSSFALDWETRNIIQVIKKILMNLIRFENL